MTVEELISELQHMKPDAEVKASCYDNGFENFTIGSVSYESSSSGKSECTIDLEKENDDDDDGY
jgi:hypothetical protein